jgi:hypothetical protein
MNLKISRKKLEKIYEKNVFPENLNAHSIILTAHGYAHSPYHKHFSCFLKSLIKTTFYPVLPTADSPGMKFVI